MTEKVYTITDLGPGDGGKGGVVHKISTMMNSHTIIKVGGAQGSHGVCTSRGERFAFSQWGCGTLEGIKTHISSRFIVLPEGLLNEAEALRYEHGIYNAFDLLTIDEEALCASPYHKIASRLKEMARGKNPRGTIGTGVGEAYRYSKRFPDLILRVRDLLLPQRSLRERLAAIREQVQNDLVEILHGKFLQQDQEAVTREINFLYDDGFLDHNVRCCQEVARRTKIVGHDYLKNEIFTQDGVAVVESSHGILTDHFHGFHPHTSAIRTLPCFMHAMLDKAGYEGQVVNIAVRRAYEIRHGAGPMPTADPVITEKLLPDSHKMKNRYQGEVRVGPLDLILMRYAIEICGGPDAFDGLAITWFDQIQTNGNWHLCDRYSAGAEDQIYFTPSGEIRVRRGTDAEQLEYQENLGKQLKRCVPEIMSYKIPLYADRDELFSFCANVLNEKIGVPVRMASFGPTELDKICK
ncbi:hypothetical protein CL633_04060 [bacterium]|nr:hypothetical protein [bacterium]|tara:strand:- start:10372 stop:11766 length:1395 start_codon:yes stop_codon:yes gene_type:complete